VTGAEPDQDALLASVAAFAREEVAPQAAAWSMGAAPEPALLERAGALGLMRIEVPLAAGGLSLGFALKARLCALLAAADFGFAMSVVNTQNAALRLARSARPRIVEALLPDLLAGRASACTALTEPGAGSDVAAMAMTARRVTGGWRLDGEKTWIVNARHARVAIVYAQCAEPGDAAGIGAFAVPLDGRGCRRRALDAPFAQTSTGTGGIVLEDCRLSEDHQLVPPGEAFGAILDEINGARAYVAAMCCAMLGAALDIAGDHGERRISFGRPLRDHQAWRFILARAGVDLAAARRLTDAAVAAVDAGAPAQLVSAQAKLAAVAACQRHLPELLHAMGAEGLRAEHPFARHLAAAQIAALTDGSTEMLLERVARLMRRPSPA